MSLIGNTILLRALEPEDLTFLYEIENNESFWEVSQTYTPFSKYLLKRYIENAHQDIFEAKQVRFVIEEKNTKNAIGMIDLFDFDAKNKRAGIGILIHPSFQNKGFATEALKILIDYSFSQLDLHQLYANISIENSNSISLFKKYNFKEVGIKKDWNFSNGKFKDEFLFQLIKY